MWVFGLLGDQVWLMFFGEWKNASCFLGLHVFTGTFGGRKCRLFSKTNVFASTGKQPTRTCCTTIPSIIVSQNQKKTRLCCSTGLTGFWNQGIQNFFHISQDKSPPATPSFELVRSSNLLSRTQKGKVYLLQISFEFPPKIPKPTKEKKQQNKTSSISKKSQISFKQTKPSSFQKKQLSLPSTTQISFKRFSKRPSTKEGTWSSNTSGISYLRNAGGAFWGFVLRQRRFFFGFFWKKRKWFWIVFGLCWKKRRWFVDQLLPWFLYRQFQSFWE